MKKIITACLLLSATGCASILEGSTQEIMINTTPQGAQCQIVRNGVAIASVMKTPEAALVERTKHDLIIKCWSDKCDESEYFVKSGTSGGTFGNILLGGGIGWAIDSAAGADNEYEEMVNVPLSCSREDVDEKPAKKKKAKKKAVVTEEDRSDVKQSKADVSNTEKATATED